MLYHPELEALLERLKSNKFRQSNSLLAHQKLLAFAPWRGRRLKKIGL